MKYEPAEYHEIDALLESGKTSGYGQRERAQSQGGVYGRETSKTARGCGAATAQEHNEREKSKSKLAKQARKNKFVFNG